MIKILIFLVCLKVSFSSSQLLTRVSLNGAVLLSTPNDQCKLRYGPTATFCQSYSSYTCSLLYCRKSNNDKWCYTDGSAPDGTICDSGKICLSGLCQTSSLAPTTPCPFGDDLVPNNTYSVVLSKQSATCQEYFEILNLNKLSIPFYCMSFSGKTSCCQSCLKYKLLTCYDADLYCSKYTSYCSRGVFTDGALVRNVCARTCKTCRAEPLRCSRNNLCLNGGICTNTSVVSTSLFGFKCTCSNGFTGELCETKLSTPSTTKNPTTTISSSTLTTKTTSFAITTSTKSTSINQNCRFGYTLNYCDECGKQPYATPNLKIVGGVEAAKHSWPSIAFILFDYTFYYTFLGRTYKTSYQSYCGGTLIDRKTVITAAHCYVDKVKVSGVGTFLVQTNQFHPTIASMYKIYLGLHSKKAVLDNTNISPGIQVAASIVKLHENYDPVSNFNDISIIKLSSEVIYNDYIQPACLPNPNIPNYPTSTNIGIWAAGWGDLSFEGTSPDNLYNVKMTLYDGKTYCSSYSPTNWNNQICAGEYSGGKDTCQGDSGGPLFVRDTVNGVQKFILVGITSYGNGCASPGYPGIYTRVSSYLNWIKNNS